MRTAHRMIHGDARTLDSIEDESVELVVTSPPYPMVEMWDAIFSEMDDRVATALDAHDGARAFELMHATLDAAWDELARVLVDGGIACINVGDATRSVGGSFRVYPNHVRILDALQSRGFDPLPEILWRKPTNAATKFMGSGMLPPNAYPTLEHEHLLICRKGERTRTFPPSDEDRYAAAYFWEERNAWFTDLWTDVTGTEQSLTGDEGRARSGAYPLAIPFRLIAMFSVYGDTVLDPFCGTGTTSVAAMCAARDSIGVEADAALIEVYQDRLETVPARSRELAASRLASHRRFVEELQTVGDNIAYTAHNYGFPVKTAQERELLLYEIAELARDDDVVTAEHRPSGTSP